jgi:selenocysteine lyase/cysteine desulfurase
VSITRRDLLAGAAVTPLLTASTAATAAAATTLPAKGDFAPMAFTYLDAGSVHPLSLGAKSALENYLRYRTLDRAAPTLNMSDVEARVLQEFATLVGASADELSFIQSTTMGENLVLQALDLPRAGGRIVTDVLHFFGSFYTYGEMQKAGVDVVSLRMTKDGRIDMNEMAAAINARTKLVSISLVSTINGFEHDLKRICDLAHAHGAYVYADIVHAAGAVPLDLHASGVDFAATSSYKWLMGDFGLGFLYVRKATQDKLRRPWWGYHQVASFDTHVFPYDAPGDEVATYTSAPNAAGRFAMGTISWTGLVHLEHSLAWLNRVGVAAIQSWRQPMVDALQRELRRRGYEPLTPADSKTPLVAFALKDARAKLAQRMSDANVRITISRHRFRFSIAVFNDMNDVDKALEALPKSPPRS